MFSIRKNEYIDTVISLNGNLHSIGFLLACPENDFFKYTSKQVSQYFNLADYQSIGSHILNAYFPTINTLKNAFPYLNINNINMDVICIVYQLFLITIICLTLKR